MGQNFHKIEAVRLEGGDPPPQAVSLTTFYEFFFYAFPNVNGVDCQTCDGVLLIMMRIIMTMMTMMKRMIMLTARSVVSGEENMWGILGFTPACPSLSLSLTLPLTLTFFQPVHHFHFL